MLKAVLIQTALSPPDSAEDTSAIIMGLRVMAVTSREDGPKTSKKLCQHDQVRVFPQLYPLSPTQSTGSYHPLALLRPSASICVVDACYSTW